MEVYTTENEQMDALRRFFAGNGKTVVIGIVIGVGALLGWRYWQGYHHSVMENASQHYEQASETLAAGKAEGVALMQAFINNNRNNYGVLAALQMAQHDVEAKKYDQAQQQLIWAQGETKDENLRSLIHLRLARILLQENKLAQALNTLDQVTLAGWRAMAQDLRGDILVKQGDLKGASDAYNAGLTSDAPAALQALLRMKMNELSN